MVFFMMDSERKESEESSRDHRGEGSEVKARKQFAGGRAACLEYWEEFECKCGRCRHSCCEGWGISLSMQEYFKLLGMDCSPELRRRLDGAFHLVDNPSPERYAQITPDWRGECPMHMEDGRCRIHAELGPGALTRICRLYPRSPRNTFGRECACSNSCERTLELLREKKAPMRFTTTQLPDESIDAPEAPDWLMRHYVEIRKLCFGRMQDRTISLTDRVLSLSTLLDAVHDALETRDDIAITEAVRRAAKLPMSTNADAPQLHPNFLRKLNQMLGEDSASVQEYANEAEKLLDVHSLGEILNRFEEKVPDWEIFFEQMLVNHMFYESFPFSDRRENVRDEALSLSIVYGYVRFLAACGMWNRDGDEALIDVCAAAFRLIDHSAFDWNSLIIFRNYIQENNEL